MTAPNPSTLWAQIFVDELARVGLRHVCLAPGSRSTPLTVAFARHPDIAVYSLLDERGASFFALGLALAGQEPAAVVCTSGTAASNFHPAVTEAYYAHIPLLILTTDRPPELRHSGANQTIDQVKMFGDHVRWFVDVALPEADPPDLSLRALRTLAARAFAAAGGLPAGPVHLNFPFRKPLEPTPRADDQPDPLPDSQAQSRFERTPFTQISSGVVWPEPAQIEELAAQLQASPRGLIVCGPRCPGGDFPQAVARLAQVTGYPLLADALSGVRFGPHLAVSGAFISAGYETYLQPNIVDQWDAPQLILRFGAMPISKQLAGYLAAHPACRQIGVTANGLWQDDTHTLSRLIWADPARTCQLAADQLLGIQASTENIKTRPLKSVTTRIDEAKKDSAWSQRFKEAETQTSQMIAAKQAETFFEGALLAEVVDLMPAEAILYVASSLPVRHLDQFVFPRPKKLRVFANRGASGIDGTIASAQGAAAATGLPLVLVIGDLAFYHDMNSLLALQRCGIKATIVLINNNGGGIFHRLPISNFDPPFTDLFLTPHGLNFEPAVRMFGAAYRHAAGRTPFQQALQESLEAAESTVIEVPTDSGLHEQIRKEIERKLSQQFRIQS